MGRKQRKLVKNIKNVQYSWLRISWYEIKIMVVKFYDQLYFDKSLISSDGNFRL